MKKKKRKYVWRTGASALTQVQRIRHRNNILWMKLVGIAIVKAPKETRKVLAAINANDDRISRWLKRV